jgi:hypothetical protein
MISALSCLYKIVCKNELKLIKNIHDKFIILENKNKQIITINNKLKKENKKYIDIIKSKY